MAAGCCAGRARLPWHPAAGMALPAEDGRLWRGGKRAGWNRGHDLATGAALNRAARDGEMWQRLAAGESVRAVARALRCGLATVQRARSAGEMRGAPRPVSGSGPPVIRRRGDAVTVAASAAGADVRPRCRCVPFTAGGA